MKGWERRRRSADNIATQQTIDTISTPDLSDFYKLWAAANAVDTLCITKGKAGMAVGNGESALFPFDWMYGHERLML